jgi:hypothetical protein
MARIHAAFADAEPLRMMSAPEDFVFPKRLFFDTVYHLKQEGRQLRTQKVIEQLNAFLAQREGTGLAGAEPSSVPLAPTQGDLVHD